MKYSLKSQVQGHVVDTVLANRGIDNVNLMLSPIAVESHHSLLDNMNKAVDTFIKHTKQGSRILIICDSDVDGFTSASLMCNYMLEMELSPLVYIHSGKQHGITSEAIKYIEEVHPQLIIIPDASSSEGVIHETLISSGIDIIVLDHHEVEGDSPAIIVNNQSSNNFPNKSLSGVGIVYKFCQALDEKFGVTGFCNKFLDLVAVGMIADVMDLRNLETRMLCSRGLKNIQNPFFKAICKKEDLDDPTILDVGFKIAPLMNAIIRVGTIEEKQMMFDCLSGKNYLVPYKPRGKTQTEQTLADAVIRVGNNAKSRQRTATNKAMEFISKQIIENNLEDSKVLIIDVTDEINKGVTGLVANKVASTYKRPVMLIHKYSEGLCGGSARSYGVSNLKDICVETGLFSLCAGHQESFGVEIIPDNVDKVISAFNEIFKDVEYSLAYEVDYIFEAKDLNKSTVEVIGDFRHLWGNGIQEPLFVVKNIKINSKDVRKIGFNIVGFSKNDIFYAKNFATSSFIDEFTCRDEIGFGEANLTIDIVCRFKKDKYGTKVEIVDYISKIDTELIF